DALHQAGGVIGVEHLGVEAAHAPLVPNHGRLADRDVQIAGLQLNNCGQQLVNENSGRHVWVLARADCRTLLHDVLAPSLRLVKGQLTSPPTADSHVVERCQGTAQSEQDGPRACYSHYPTFSLWINGSKKKSRQDLAAANE